MMAVVVVGLSKRHRCSIAVSPLLLCLLFVQHVWVVKGGYIIRPRSSTTCRTATTRTWTTCAYAPPPIGDHEIFGKKRHPKRRYNLCCLFASTKRSSIGRAKNSKGRKKQKQQAKSSYEGSSRKNKNGTNKSKSRASSSSPKTHQHKYQQQTSSSDDDNYSRKKQSSSAPPWQVLSAKDATKNVQKEIQRRELARKRQGQGGGSYSQQQQQQQQQHDGEEVQNQTRVVYSKAFLTDIEQRLLNWKRFNPTSPIGIRFVGSCLGSHSRVPRLGVPEIAFLGRSNVGKSSLLNRLSSSSSSTTGARVGKTPGSTASVNMYALQDKKGKDLIAFVDLPGFGYAKLSKEVKEQVQIAAENYLNNRNNEKATTKELALGVLLVDIRRIPSDDDRAVLAALYDMGVPLIVVATKIDKIDSETQRQNRLEIIRDRLGLPGRPLAISSTTGEGCRQLWRIILEACETTVSEFKIKYEDDEEVDNSIDDIETGATVDVDDDEEGDVGDDDDLVYDQGYDWIHATDDDIMMYEDEGGDDEGVGDLVGANDWEEDEDTPTTEGSRRETIQSLKKKARKLEKRGEL